MTKDELRRRVLAAITAAPEGLTKKEIYKIITPVKNLIRSLYVDLELDGLFAAGTVDNVTRPARGKRPEASVFRLAMKAETVAVTPEPKPGPKASPVAPVPVPVATPFRFVPPPPPRPPATPVQTWPRGVEVPHRRIASPLPKRTVATVNVNVNRDGDPEAPPAQLARPGTPGVPTHAYGVAPRTDVASLPRCLACHQPIEGVPARRRGGGHDYHAACLLAENRERAESVQASTAELVSRRTAL